jgi:hypothetical protein
VEELMRRVQQSNTKRRQLEQGRQQQHFIWQRQGPGQAPGPEQVVAAEWRRPHTAQSPCTSQPAPQLPQQAQQELPPPAAAEPGTDEADAAALEQEREHEREQQLDIARLTKKLAALKQQALRRQQQETQVAQAQALSELKWAVRNEQMEQEQAQAAMAKLDPREYEAAQVAAARRREAVLAVQAPQLGVGAAPLRPPPGMSSFEQQVLKAFTL